MNLETAAAEYWEGRARRYALRGPGLAAVCSYGMPAFYNRYIDLCQRRALAPWLKQPVRSGGATLDIGCGVGRWSLALARRGHDVTGVDLSPHMIEVAHARAQQVGTAGAACRFLVGDAATLSLGRAFDLIFCVTVLQHITEDAKAEAALARLATHLTRDGTLVLLEAAPSQACSRCDSRTFRARTVEWYRQALQSAGLQLLARRGVDPLPLKTWLLPKYQRMPLPVRLAALAATTAISLPFDWMLGRALSRYSWHAVFVARKR